MPPPVLPSQARVKNRNARERARILAKKKNRISKPRRAFQLLKKRDRLGVAVIYEMIYNKEEE